MAHRTSQIELNRGRDCTELVHEASNLFRSAGESLCDKFQGSSREQRNRNTLSPTFGNKAVEAAGRTGDGAAIDGDNLAQILGIEPRGQCRRADQLAEHHGQLPALGGGWWCRCIAGCRSFGDGRHRDAECGDGVE